MATFNAVGNSLQVYATPGDEVSYTLDDTGGTFAGTIRLMRADRPSGAHWTTLADITDGDQDGTWTNDVGRDQYVKLLVTEYTGDSTAATLTLSSDVQGDLVLSGNKIKSSEGHTLVTFTEGLATFDESVTIPGTMTAGTGGAASAPSYAMSQKVPASDTMTSLAQVETVLPGTWASVSKTDDFTVDTSSAKITYTGSATKTFEVSCTFSCANCVTFGVLVYGIAKNGTGTPTSQENRCYYVSNARQMPHPAFHIYELEENDYVEIVMNRLTGTSNIDVITGHFMLREIPT